MLSINVYNESGQQIGTEQIDEALLGGEVNTKLLKQAIVMYHANKRQGTVKQKTRAEVQGSTRKIYKQKGTGRARMGAVRQPVRRGGGRAFPRQPRDFRLDMPKTMRRLARNNALLAKMQGNAVSIVDGVKFDGPKTKRFAAMLVALKVEKGCTLLTKGIDQAIYKSGRNIPKTRIMDVAELNAWDLLQRKQVIFTKEAFAELRNIVGKTA
ncbi:MAG: 50S ribosomal protein L4 [Phycisphaerae bacterium]